MGLDMYLSKAKKVVGVSPSDISKLNLYLSYLNREAECADSKDIEKIKDYSLYEYCSLNEEDIRKDLIDFYKDTYVKRYSDWDEEKKFGWNSLWEEIGYWRKANAIHNWFVDNVQDGEDNCGSYEVSKEQLETLLDTVKTVLADHNKASEYLPTESGFFFGSTDYDDWYFSQLSLTEELLEKILTETNFDTELVVYQSSW